MWNSLRCDRRKATPVWKGAQTPLPSPRQPHQILLRLGIAECGRLFVPLPRRLDVAADAGALHVHHPEIVHVGGVAERNALLEQLSRFGVVARNALAVEIEQA